MTVSISLCISIMYWEIDLNFLCSRYSVVNTSRSYHCLHTIRPCTLLFLVYNATVPNGNTTWILLEVSFYHFRHLDPFRCLTLEHDYPCGSPTLNVELTDLSAHDLAQPDFGPPRHINESYTASRHELINDGYGRIPCVSLYFGVLSYARKSPII